MNDRETAFIERMAAEATHEIMNGLASIGQAAGLMNDLVDMGIAGGGGLSGIFSFGKGKKSGPDVKGRFKKSIGSVQNGLAKSMSTTQALNRFMHGLTPGDKPAGGEELLLTLAALMRRSARQKRVEFEIGNVDPEAALAVPPFSTYRALAACIDSLLHSAEPGSVITLSCRTESAHVAFEARSQSPKPETLPETLAEALQDVSRALPEIAGEMHDTSHGYVVKAPAAAVPA